MSESSEINKHFTLHKQNLTIFNSTNRHYFTVDQFQRSESLIPDQSVILSGGGTVHSKVARKLIWVLTISKANREILI